MQAQFAPNKTKTGTNWSNEFRAGCTAAVSYCRVATVENIFIYGENFLLCIQDLFWGFVATKKYVGQISSSGLDETGTRASPCGLSTVSVI